MCGIYYINAEEIKGLLESDAMLRRLAVSFIQFFFSETEGDDKETLEGIISSAYWVLQKNAGPYLLDDLEGLLNAALSFNVNGNKKQNN